MCNVYFESWSFFRKKDKLAMFICSHKEMEAMHMEAILKSMTNTTYYL